MSNPSRPGRHCRRVLYRACFLAATALLAPYPAFAQTTATWVNAVSGTWADPTMWSANPAYPVNGVPNAGAAYDVVVAAQGGPYTVYGINDAVTVNSLSIASPDVTVDFGSPNLQYNFTAVNGISVSAGTLRLTNNGHLLDTHITTSGTGSVVLAPNATVDFGGSSSLDTNLVIPATAAVRTVWGTTALPNNHTISVAGTFLTFSDVNIIGNGTLSFDGAATDLPEVALSGHTSLAPTITIATGTSGGRIGMGDGVTLGAVRAQTPGQTLTLDTGSDHGYTTASVASMTLTAGTLDLRADLTPASFANFTRTGGDLLLGGNVIATSGRPTLPLQGDATLTGTLNRLTITNTPGHSLRYTASASPLTACSIQTDVSVDPGVTFTLANLPGVATTVNGAISLGTGCRVMFPTTNGNIAGSGQIVFNGTDSSNQIVGYPGDFAENGPFVIPAGFTVRTGTGGGTLGGTYYDPNRYYPFVTSTGFINNGTISAETPGQTLTLLGSWSSTGPIKLSAGTLVLGGGFSGSSLKKFTQTGGDLLITGSATLDYPLTLNVPTRFRGARLSNGSVIVGTGGAFTIDGPLNGSGTDPSPTLTNVSLTGNVAFNSYGPSATLHLAGTTTLKGTLSLDVQPNAPYTGGSATIALDGNVTLATPAPVNPAVPDVGSIVFNAPNTSVIPWTGTGSITIGPSFTIRTGAASGTVGTPATPTVPILNRGALAADTPSTTLTVNAYPLTNEGTVRAPAGGTLVIPNLQNAATGAVTLAGGATLTVSPTSGFTWSNAGSLSSTNSTVSFSGTGSSSGSIVANGGSLALSGTWTNSGTITATNAAVSLGGSWINSGSVSVTGGSLTLSGGWNGTGTLSASGSAVSITAFPSSFVPPLSFPNSTVSIVGTTFTTAQVLPNSPGAAITLGFNGTINNVSDTLTLSALSPSVTLAGGYITGGSVASPDSTALPAVSGSNYLTNVTLSAPSHVLAGAGLQLSGGSNSATVTVDPGATLTLAGSFTNTGTISIPNGGTLALAGPFSSPTPIPVTSANVRIAGAVPYATVLSDIAATSSTFTLAFGGNLDLGGATFVQSATNPWTVAAGGRFSNGTLTGDITLPTTVSLTNVTLAATPVFAPGAFNLTITNNLTLNDVNLSMPSGAINFSGAQSLTGTGTISFDSTTTPAIRPQTPNAPLTIGPNITIKSGSGSGTVGTSSIGLVNKGTLSAQTAGKSLTVTGSNWSNTGTLEAKNNSTLTLGGTLTTPNLGTVSTSTGGSVVLTGSLTNTTSTLAISASSNIALGNGGTITNGSLTTPDDSALNVLAATGTLTSTLSGVDVNVPVSLQPGAVLRAPGSTFRQPLTATSATFNITAASPLPSFLSTATLTDSTVNVTVPLASSALLASLTRTNTPINLSAAVTNTGNIIPVDATTGALNLPTNTTGAGSVTGGTIGSPAGGGVVVLGTAGNTLSGFFSYVDSVTLLNTTLTVPQSQTGEARNSLTLSGNSRISLLAGPPSTFNSTRLRLDSLTGSGEITFDGDPALGGGSSVVPRFSTLNIPAGITVRTNTTGGFVQATTFAGTVSGQTPGQGIALAVSKLTGTVEARNGGRVDVLTQNSPIFTNFTGPSNSLTLTGGTWNAYNSSAINVWGFSANTLQYSITTANADITLSGPTSSFLALNSLITNAGSLTLTAGRTFTTAGDFTNSGTLTLGPSAALKVKGILTNTGSLSLASPTSALLVDYTGLSPIDALRNDLRTGHLTTTVPGTAIAYVEASQLDLTTFAGLPVDATTLLTKLTLPGDANLDGKLNADDYALLDRSFAKSLTNAHWTDGDFNYDGTITSADYLQIDATYLQQQGGAPSPEFLSQRESQFGGDYVAQLLTNVPEPSSAACLAAGLLPLARRRRRHRK